MADTKDIEVLIRLGPFKSLDSRTRTSTRRPATRTALSNADTHRNPARSRTSLVVNRFSSSRSSGTTRSRSWRATTSRQIMRSLSRRRLPTEAYYDTLTQQFTSLSQMTAPFTESAQSNGVLFLNNGYQIIYGADGFLHVARWQYPAPDPSSTDSSSRRSPETRIRRGRHLLLRLRQVVSIPSANGTIQQITTPTGSIGPPFPAGMSMTSDGTLAAGVDGVFAGTTAEGYPFVTQVYRYSTNVPEWLLLTTLRPTPLCRHDAGPDRRRAGARPQPRRPTDRLRLRSQSDRRVSDRMFVLAVVNNALTNNQPETQLW